MKASFIILFLLVIILGLLIAIIINLTGEKSKCLNNPIVYGLNILSRLNNDEVICSCSFLKGGWFIATKENLTIQHQNVRKEIKVNASIFDEIKK